MIHQFPSNSSRTRASAGAGILGVLIVVAIMLFLYAGPTGKDGSSSIERALTTKKMGEELNLNIQAMQVVQMVVIYKLANDDKVPTTYEELEMAPPLDPWGNPMMFRIDDDPKQVVVISNGRDGKPGTEDDVQGKASLPI